MQHQHRTADFAGIADGRAHQRDRHRAAVQALNQLGVFTAATELAAQNMLDQGETIGLGIFVQQVEQRRQRQSRRLLGLPVGHRFGRRIHVGNRTGNICGDHAVANRLQGDLRPLFLQLQRIGEGMALLEQLAGAHQRQRNQSKRSGEVSQQQQTKNDPRPFPQCITEGFRRRSHFIIDREDLLLPALDIRIRGRAGIDVLMHVPGNVIELGQIGIPHGPQIDGFFEVTEVTKVEVQPDQAGNVVRVVAPLEDRQPRRFDVWRLLIQRHTQFMPALRHGNGVPVLIKYPFVAAVGVEVQVIDGIFLALGPKAFAGNIAANSRQHIKANATQQSLKQHNGDKWPDDAQQPWRSESPRLIHEVPCISTACSSSGRNRYSQTRGHS
ncbi:hypothetical protein D9M71_65960 [compost metagenome]